MRADLGSSHVRKVSLANEEDASDRSSRFNDRLDPQARFGRGSARTRHVAARVRHDSSPTSSARSERARPHTDDHLDPSTASRFDAPARDADGTLVKNRTTSDANPSGSAQTRMPSDGGSPSAPTGVVTTGRAAAIASMTFSLVPPPAKRGAMTTAAREYSSTNDSRHPTNDASGCGSKCSHPTPTTLTCPQGTSRSTSGHTSRKNHLSPEAFAS